MFPSLILMISRRVPPQLVAWWGPEFVRRSNAAPARTILRTLILGLLLRTTCALAFTENIKLLLSVLSEIDA